MGHPPSFLFCGGGKVGQEKLKKLKKYVDIGFMVSYNGRVRRSYFNTNIN